VLTNCYNLLNSLRVRNTNKNLGNNVTPVELAEFHEYFWTYFGDFEPQSGVISDSTAMMGGGGTYENVAFAEGMTSNDIDMSGDMESTRMLQDSTKRSLETFSKDPSRLRKLIGMFQQVLIRFWTRGSCILRIPEW